MGQEELRNLREPDGESLHLDRRRLRFEIAAKRLELRLRERELQVSIWRNPLLLGILAAFLGFVGNIMVTYVQHLNQTVTAQKEFESKLILEAIKTANPSAAT